MVFKWQFALIAAFIAHRSFNINVPLRCDYVGVAMSDKSGDKSELPFENNGTSLLSPLLSSLVHDVITIFF
jgi:hypothetical protein